MKYILTLWIIGAMFTAPIAHESRIDSNDIISLLIAWPLALGAVTARHFDIQPIVRKES